MKARASRDRRPAVEALEGRLALSAITAVMSGNAFYSRARLAQRAAAASSDVQGAPQFRLSPESIAVPSNQGPLLNPDGSVNNMSIAPTGRFNRRALRQQRFVGKYKGPYTVLPGRTTDEARQIIIQGTGTSNTMLHSDFQARLVVPKDPSLPVGASSSIFDRNLNTNTVLGLDMAAPQSDLDRRGRPVFFPTVSGDQNESAGTYDEPFVTGVIHVRYIPNHRRSVRGAIEQGTAVVTIHAQVYAPNTNFVLRNALINP